jgi:hypothetical protein
MLQLIKKHSVCILAIALFRDLKRSIEYAIEQRKEAKSAEEMISFTLSISHEDDEGVRMRRY